MRSKKGMNLLFNYVDFTGEENEKEFLEKCYKQWEIAVGSAIPDIQKIVTISTIFSEMRHRIDELG